MILVVDNYDSFTYNLVQEANTAWVYSPAIAWKNVVCASCSAGHAALAANIHLMVVRRSITAPCAACARGCDRPRATPAP